MFDNRFIGRPELVLAGLVLAVALLLWAGRRLRRAKRPDDSLSSLAMLAGFGWSSEAVWVLAGPDGADLPTPIRIALFTIFEVILVVFMIRAKRNMKTIGHPGRAGRNAWMVAAGMSLVAVTTAHNVGEGILRLLVPVLLTAMWWDGLVGEGAQRPAWVTSWRWTPRRILLWLGAIEPGERDVETVHRARLTQQMVRLEFRRRHGSDRQRERAAGRLARLSLAADDQIVADVRERVDRAMWFEQSPAPALPARPAESISASVAASLRAARVRHRRRIRTIRVAQAHTCPAPAQEPEPDRRTVEERDMAIRAVRLAFPDLTQSRIAAVTATSPTTVRRALRRTTTLQSGTDLAPDGA